jgi:hypothetical protein
VIKDEFGVVALPYAVLAPYSTCVSLASLVVQLAVAPDEVIEDAFTLETTGGVVSPPPPLPAPCGTRMIKTSLLVVLPQLLVNATNLPSRLVSALGVSQ